MTSARARPRTRPPTPSVPAPGPAELEDVAPDVARMRTALELTAAGRTQPEIARALGCSERNVRYILKAARARQVATFRSRSPEAILADVEHRAAVQYGRWTAAWVRARNARDLRAEALILARMDAALVGRVAMLARVGFFDNVTFHTGASGTETDRRAQRGRKELDALVSMSAALNRGEDMDGLALDIEDDAQAFDPDDPFF